MLNSLSQDFIAVSHALLAEGGYFEEIGKLGTWSYEFVAACTSSRYDMIDIGESMGASPQWMNGVLKTLSRRAAEGRMHALPLRSFDMLFAYEQAFRLLQGGNNVGKVVLSLGDTTDKILQKPSTHLVTSGTASVGLLIARWLANTTATKVLLLLYLIHI